MTMVAAGSSRSAEDGLASNSVLCPKIGLSPGLDGNQPTQDNILSIMAEYPDYTRLSHFILVYTPIFYAWNDDWHLGR